MLDQTLSPQELAERWHLTTRTLKRLRMNAQGPLFLRIAGRISYRAQEIQKFEDAHLCRHTGHIVPPKRSASWRKNFG